MSITATYLISVGVLVAFVAKRVWIFLGSCKMDKRLEMHISPIQPMSILGALLPTTWWNPGMGFIFRDRAFLYKHSPIKTKKITPLFFGSTVIWTANLAAFRQVLANNSAFGKSEAGIKDLQFMGVNVVASEGDTWKRHRRIAAPAFNHTTYQNVWTTTVNVYKEMLGKEGWRNADEARVPNLNLLTHKLALFIITIVGFGIPMVWDEPERDASGRLSIQSMIFNVANSILIRSRTPRLAYGLGIERLSRVDEAYSGFERFMMNRITAREAELTKARALGDDAEVEDGIRDVFGRLVNARLTEGRFALTDKEIVGNCFILAFAGHETTANTLTATLALLGLYPEAQDWVYRSIRNVLGDREPTFDDFDALDDVLACFYEALRLFPAAYLMFRQAFADTILKLPRSDNPEIVADIPVKKGTYLVLDMVGMSYDESTFPNPEAFEPWRWSKTNGSSLAPTNKENQAGEVAANAEATALDGFVNFSFGPRTCLGHKFTKVEAVAFLTYLLREWRVEVELAKGESKEEWRKKILKPSFGIAMTLGTVPIRLVRRSKE